MLRRSRFVPDSLETKPDQPFFFLLCFSVLLHGLILALPASFGNRATGNHKILPIQAKIRVQVNQTPAHVWSESAQVERRFTNISPRKLDSAHTMTQRPAQQPLIGNVTTLPESDISPKSSFNLENLREQARALAKEPSDQAVRGEDRSRHASETVVPDLMDRPVLEAISRRLGQPLRVMSEQIMNDGSRLIRFSGNTCLHIPRHLPFGRESEFTQTVLLSTNCP